MQVILVYAIAYASVVGVFAGWRLAQFLATHARARIYPTLSKWLLYTLVITRINGTSDMTVAMALTIASLVIGNVVGSILLIKSQLDFSKRLARLCITNMVALYLGGRTNLIADRVFWLSHNDYHLLHRWLGRVAVIEGLVHAVLRLVQHHDGLRVVDITLLALLGSLSLTSALPIRRRCYELFLKTHTILAIAFLVAVWLHLPHLDTYLLTCLIAAASVFALQKFLSTVVYVYQNLGTGSQSQASVTRYSHSGPDDEVYQISVDIKRPWTVIPGQFIYLTLPQVRSLGLSVFEAHPFTIAWVVEDERGRAKSIVLLVRACQGFTRKLKFANSLTHALVKGPYGGKEATALRKYDKILLMSSGVGIAAHLHTTKYLLLAHNQQTARVRRLTLLWFLETKDQIRWAEEFLEALCDLDSRTILTIYLFSPDESEGSSKSLNLDPPKTRMFPIRGSLDMAMFIEGEWGAEAGNMLVMVCGGPQFESRARQAVRASSHDIHLQNSCFQPDETRVSKSSTLRYNQESL